MIVFIVEDDPFYADMLSYQVNQNPDNTSYTFNSGKELFAFSGVKPDVITMDYSLPDFTGIELLKQLNTRYPDIPKIVISSLQDVEKVVQLFDLGVKDYLVKDSDTKDRLWMILSNIKETKGLKEEVKTLKKEVRKAYQADTKLVGNSTSMKRVFQLMQKAYTSNISVSIYGETGTGKEVVAKSIHYNSQHIKGKFIAVNMAAIPENLIESELFGHEKGSFTGATMRRVGKFEEANGGTIFLDEIAELNTNLQAKILRVLQENEIVPIGGNKTVKLDLRIISATHTDLATLVQEGKFREDLYYRLMGLQLQLPSLRERGNDILLLSNYFLEEYQIKNNLPKLDFSVQAKKKLMSYSYPGNIRELRSIVELSAVMRDDVTIEPEDIKFYGVNTQKGYKIQEMSLKKHCAAIIDHFLKEYDNNVIKVSQILEISKSKIYQMIKEGEL